MARHAQIAANKQRVKTDRFAERKVSQGTMEATEVEGGRNVSLAPELSPSLAAAEDHFRVKRRALEAVLDNCKRALELLEKPYIDLDPAGDEAAEAQTMGEVEGSLPRSESGGDSEADELCALLKSRVESPDFLEKLEHIQTSVYQNIHGDDNASWDLVTAKDLWDDKHFDGKDDTDQDDYVLVKQEDIVDGVACFMATYLLSLKQTKELTPNQLQEALCKTFSVKKKKSRLRKAWDGSKVIYNVASWSATAIGYVLYCKKIEGLLSRTNIYLMLIWKWTYWAWPCRPILTPLYGTLIDASPREMWFVDSKYHLLVMFSKGE